MRGGELAKAMTVAVNRMLNAQESSAGLIRAIETMVGTMGRFNGKDVTSLFRLIGCADFFSRLGSLFLFVFPCLVLLLSDRFFGACTCLCSPPQVRHIETLHAKHLREVLQLVRSERLVEDVGNLPIGLNIPKFDFIAQDPLAHEVIMYLNMLCASIEHRVLGQLHTADVVAVDRNRSRNCDPKVMQ